MSGLNPSARAKSRWHERLDTKVGQAQGPVHLGVPTADDVERQPLGRLLEHVDLQGVVLTPAVERAGEGLETMLAEAARQLGASLAGQLA